jgi:ferric-dicitrate binding protein FerR (iron transport regulator)
MDKDYIIQLLQRYFTNQATHADREALFAEVEKHKNNEEWVELLATLRPQVEEIKEYNPEHYQSVINTILTMPQQLRDGKTKKGPRVIRIWKWVAAACILALIGIATYVILSGVEGRHKEPPVATTHDVAAPKETRAVITLANGSKVYLDSVDNGTIATEADVSVVKTEDGRIIYSHKDTETQSEIAYNTLTNPRGSKVIDMQLTDGSHVWLNSGSSITYPVAFIGKERIVEITGEAYFEVAHNASKPFHVMKGETDVMVLGTHFNVNAYDDEESLKVTLLEGSVKVGIGNKELGIRREKEVTIKPGEQAVVGIGNSELGIRKEIDLDEVMAWKNGRFLFREAGIETILREAARWYDLDISYDDKINETFNGGISRTVNVSQLFHILEATGKVKFEISGKKVIVKKS